MKRFSVLLTLLLIIGIVTGTTQVPAPKAIASAEQCTKAPSSMISWWPAEGDAIDIVDGNYGTMQNGTTFASGKVNQAFSLDGIDDYVRIENEEPFDFERTDSFTIDAWIKTSEVFPNQMIFSKYIRPVGILTGYFFQVLSSGRPELNGFPGLNLGMNTSDGQSMLLESVVNYADGEFHHVAATYDGSSSSSGMNLYFDGVLAPRTFEINNINSGTILNDGKPEIGNNTADGDSYFHGSIDEVEVFNRALTADEIAAIHQAGSAGKCREVTICHMPGEPAEKSLTIPIQALSGHQDHGDTIGSCL